MRTDASAHLAMVLADPKRAADLRAEDIPAVLGALEQVRAALWARMLRAPTPVARDPDGSEQLLTVAEIATELRFTLSYVYDAVRRGQLSAVRKGKYVRIRRADLKAWLDGFSSRGLDPRPAHPDSGPLHGSPPTGRPGIRPQVRGPARASRGRGAGAVAANRPAAAQEPR